MEAGMEEVDRLKEGYHTNACPIPKDDSHWTGPSHVCTPVERYGRGRRAAVWNACSAFISIARFGYILMVHFISCVKTRSRNVLATTVVLIADAVLGRTCELVKTDRTLTKLELNW
ncbi:hypothetical protein FA15DRAFT_97181 [Coprinopsis marcescibilis]|uniref:Uncharacterized protein n=1 Tax=Coprinopsis marcescibilis TaxID=230819 RepID=A0A5C3KL72_COPMA|nr:hypothetical protein FA15DRAFT_97181 [Coprinopsis marcescibilis]